MARMRLPDRRPAVSARLDHEGGHVHATAGFDPAAGQVREVFLRRGGPPGSDMDRLLDDVGVLLSRLLQLDVAPADLARGVGRLGDYPRIGTIYCGETVVALAAPASIVGVAVDWLARLVVEIDDDDGWGEAGYSRGDALAEAPAPAMKVAPDVARIRAEQDDDAFLDTFKPGGTD